MIVRCTLARGGPFGSVGESYCGPRMTRLWIHPGPCQIGHSSISKVELVSELSSAVVPFKGALSWICSRGERIETAHFRLQGFPLF